MKLLTLAAYAATHGATKQAATGWKAKGLLVFSGDLVDVDASDANMQKRLMGRFKVATRRGGKADRRRNLLDHGQLRPSLVDRPDGRLTSAAEKPGDPWRTDDPKDAGVQIESAARELRARAAPNDELADWLLNDLVDHADTVMFAWWDENCEIVRWSAWATTIAPALARDLGLTKRVGAVRAALEKQMAARLLEIGFTAEDVAELGRQHPDATQN